MTTYRAAWVLPIAGAPLRDATVTVEAGRIVDVAAGSSRSAGDLVELGQVALLPSLVNAHTHLELSYLHRAVAPAERFVDWIRPLMAARRGYPNPEDPAILDAAARAVGELRRSGTGIVGDVSNTLVTAPILRDAQLPSHLFYELIGFNAPNAAERVAEAAGRLSSAIGGSVRASLAPHAPYSVAPSLFREIRAELDRSGAPVSTVHLGESAEEVELLREGGGPWRTLLEELGAWSSTWTAPGGSPVAYLDDLGFLDRRVLAVHGVQFTAADLERLRALDVIVVSCPRSNEYVGVGSPPLASFYAAGLSVAFGTDSLASVEDLNLFGELREARRIAPQIAAGRLLESATRVGAEALGFGADYGTIEPGKRASVIAVRVPPDVVDVEEYLVGGVTPDAVSWLPVS